MAKCSYKEKLEVVFGVVEGIWYSSRNRNIGTAEPRDIYRSYKTAEQSGIHARSTA